MFHKLLFIFLIASLLAGCSLFSKKGNSREGAVARVYEKYLYPADLDGLVPAGTAKTDSIEITGAYINNWIRQELLLKQAEDNLDESSINFEKEIEQYRNSLIIYTYESELVNQKLDTVVAMSEIEAYYEANKENFQLRENILLASFVKADKNVKSLQRIKNLLQSRRGADREKLRELCDENGLEYYLNEGEWMTFSELKSKIPVSVDDPEEFLQKNRYFEVKDSATIYYVAIDEYKSKESISPLGFETQNIRMVLLNKRKAELLHRMEEDLYGDAVKRKKYEIFKK